MQHSGQRSIPGGLSEVSRRFKKSLNQGGLAIKIYIRNNAVSGSANTARSTSKMAMHRSIRLVIVIVVSGILRLSVPTGTFFELIKNSAL